MALSSILEAILMQKVPQAFEVESDQEASAPEKTPSSPASLAVTAANPVHRLPSECPKCGAPLRPQAVQWDQAGAAHCPYCGVFCPC